MLIVVASGNIVESVVSRILIVVASGNIHVVESVVSVSRMSKAHVDRGGDGNKSRFCIAFSGAKELTLGLATFH